MVAKKAEENSEIVIMAIDTGTMDFCVVGTTPLIINRVSQKSGRELLSPSGKKGAVEKASSLKHDPIKEFRDSPYLLQEKDAPTLIAGLSAWFKKSMLTAALDTPGAKKTQIGRLVRVTGERIPVYGIPKLFMAITRSADMNRTPDVRSRALLPEWACRVRVTFTKPMLREQSIANLLAMAGITSGVGDWRQEKGSGSYGSFRLASADDPDFLRIIKTQGRAAQQAAMDNPAPYDDETSDMLAWFDVEAKRRGFKTGEAEAAVKHAKGNGKAKPEERARASA